MSKLRQQYKKGNLSNERKRRLDKVGFIWSVKNVDDGKWNERFRQLKAYKEEHGDCNVPAKYDVDGFKLGKWVANQRHRCKNGKLSDECTKRLEEIGFSWTVGNVSWSERYEQLRAYKRAHGDCNVPEKYAKNRQLGRWVKWQRQYHKIGKLSDQRRELLEEMGLQWAIGTGNNFRKDEQWSERLEQLRAYKAEHENCNVPERYAKNRQLGRWVQKQRETYKSGKLSHQRRARLEEIGFRF